MDTDDHTDLLARFSIDEPAIRGALADDAAGIGDVGGGAGGLLGGMSLEDDDGGRSGSTGR